MGAAADGGVRLDLSDGDALDADQVVFASGYRADLDRVPYLSGVLDRVSVTDGFPDLSEGFETSLSGLYVVGFSATRDFGPFYGFTKGVHRRRGSPLTRCSARPPTSRRG